MSRVVLIRYGAEAGARPHTEDTEHRTLGDARLLRLPLLHGRTLQGLSPHLVLWAPASQLRTLCRSRVVVAQFEVVMARFRVVLARFRVVLARFKVVMTWFRVALARFDGFLSKFRVSCPGSGLS